MTQDYISIIKVEESQSPSNADTTIAGRSRGPARWSGGPISPSIDDASLFQISPELLAGIKTNLAIPADKPLSRSALKRAIKSKTGQEINSIDNLLTGILQGDVLLLKTGKPSKVATGLAQVAGREPVIAYQQQIAVWQANRPVLKRKPANRSSRSVEGEALFKDSPELLAALKKVPKLANGTLRLIPLTRELSAYSGNGVEYTHTRLIYALRGKVLTERGDVSKLAGDLAAFAGITSEIAYHKKLAAAKRPKRTPRALPDQTPTRIVTSKSAENYPLFKESPVLLDAVRSKLNPADGIVRRHPLLLAFARYLDRSPDVVHVALYEILKGDVLNPKFGWVRVPAKDFAEFAGLEPHVAYEAQMESHRNAHSKTAIAARREEDLVAHLVDLSTIRPQVEFDDVAATLHAQNDFGAALAVHRKEGVAAPEAARRRVGAASKERDAKPPKKAHKFPQWITHEIGARPLRRSPYANTELNVLLTAYERLETPLITIEAAARALIACEHGDLVDIQLLHFLAGRTPLIDLTRKDVVYMPLPRAMAEIGKIEPGDAFKDALEARGIIILDNSQWRQRPVHKVTKPVFEPLVFRPPDTVPGEDIVSPSRDASPSMPTEGFFGLVAATALRLWRQEPGQRNATSITTSQFQQLVLSRLQHGDMRHRTAVAARYAAFLENRGAVVEDGEITRDARGIMGILGINPHFIDPQTGAILKVPRVPPPPLPSRAPQPPALPNSASFVATPAIAPTIVPPESPVAPETRELNTPEPDPPSPPPVLAEKPAIPLSTVLIDAIAASSEVFVPLLEKNGITSDAGYIAAVAEKNRISLPQAQIAVRQAASSDVLERHSLKFKRCAALVSRGVASTPDKVFGNDFAIITAINERPSDSKISEYFYPTPVEPDNQIEIFNQLSLKRPEIGWALAACGVGAEYDYISRYMATANVGVEEAVEAMIAIYNDETTIEVGTPRRMQYTRAVINTAEIANMNPDILFPAEHARIVAAEKRKSGIGQTSAKPASTRDLSAIGAHFPYYVERLEAADIHSEAMFVDAIAALPGMTRQTALMVIAQLRRGMVAIENDSSPTFSGYAHTAARVINLSAEKAFPEAADKMSQAVDSDALLPASEIERDVKAMRRSNMALRIDTPILRGPRVA